MKKLYLFLLFLSSFSFSQILTDDFNYPDNTLLTANGWTAFSGAATQAVDVGAANGLTYADYSGLTGFTAAEIGNAVRLDNNGEDVSRNFTSAKTTGTVYYSFLMKVSAVSEVYFAGLFTSGTTFGNRLFLKPATTAGKFLIGISNTSTATYGTTEFDYDKTYLVIVKYDVSTFGSTSVWVKSSGVPSTEIDAGTPEVSTSGSGSASVSGFFLRQHNAAQNITLDGLRIYGTWFNETPCSLQLGTATTACDNVTLNIDTYTVTIPFTGGGTGTYNLSVSSGTVSGDNPSSATNGNIIISGVTEGTNVTLSVSGACTFSKTILAPECKPINTLPYNESFPYTIGNSLNNEQKWTFLNTGDDIIVDNGNLSYSGITSSGNSVSFAGAGKESITKFGVVNSGTLYSHLLFKVKDYSAVTVDLTPMYFANFIGTDNSVTLARLWVRKSGTKYQFGIGTGTAATTVVWSSNLYDINTIQYLILGYDFSTNLLYLYENQLNPSNASVSVTPEAQIVNFGGFMLRQDADNNTPSIVIDELNITTSLTLGIKDIAKSKIDLVKNTVVKDVLNFGAKANVQFFNMNGQVVKSASVEKNTSLNVSSLPKGVYVVTGEVNGQSVSQKIVKQ